jgi:nitroimidazol reductase NimA-like FMN-containing flavoprotein (pyridoxamine 5'-phosphate oxidase superfamily)
MTMRRSRQSLDRALIASIASVAGGEPLCIPALCARGDDALSVHGSRASRAMRVLARGDRACLTATLVRRRRGARVTRITPDL